MESLSFYRFYARTKCTAVLINFSFNEHDTSAHISNPKLIMYFRVSLNIDSCVEYFFLWYDTDRIFIRLTYF